jgi:hypothetical protein
LRAKASCRLQHERIRNGVFREQKNDSTQDTLQW